MFEAHIHVSIYIWSQVLGHDQKTYKLDTVLLVVFITVAEDAFEESHHS